MQLREPSQQLLAFGTPAFPQTLPLPRHREEAMVAVIDMARHFRQVRVTIRRRTFLIFEGRDSRGAAIGFSCVCLHFARVRPVGRRRESTREAKPA